MTITEYQLRLAREPTFPTLPPRMYGAFLLALAATEMGQIAVAKRLAFLLQTAKETTDDSLPGR